MFGEGLAEEVGCLRAVQRQESVVERVWLRGRCVVEENEGEWVCLRVDGGSAIDANEETLGRDKCK